MSGPAYIHVRSEVSRRSVLGAGLVIGFAAMTRRKAYAAGEQPGLGKIQDVTGKGETGDAFKGFAPGGFIRVPPEGNISLIVPNVEMGQGIYTGEAMLIAEELEVGLDQIEVLAAPPNEQLYRQPLLKSQTTGGSTSIRGAYTPLRQAGAAARVMIINAAAGRWQVAAAECTADRATATRTPTGRTLSYGELALDAERQPVPQNVPLKDPAQWKLIGTPARRTDSPGKVNGSATFGIDIRVPNMKIAAVSACPVIGGKLVSVQPDPQRSPEQNRGAYLVEALGHCGECHTPRNQLYGLDSKQKFAGAVTAGWKAYNITSGRSVGIGAWSDQTIADYLTKGFAQDHGPASGSMGEAVEYSLSHLTPDDVKAMVAYMRTIPAIASQGEQPVAEAPQTLKASTQVTPPQQEADGNSLGLEIFQSACASCHGFDGTGVNDPRAALIGSQTVNDPDGINLIQVLLQGSHLRTDKFEAMMPPFQAYRNVELAAVANYVIAHFGAKSAQISPNHVASARQAH